MEYFSKKYPLKNEIVHVKLANKRKSGIIQEEEWVDIVKHMYEDDDALQISDVRVALMELVLQAFDSDLCLGKLRARRQDAAGEKQQARVPCVSIHLLL